MRTRSRSLVLATAVAMFLFMSRGVVGPISSLYVRSLGASYAALGLLGTLGSLTGLVASPLWGRLCDRLGRRRPVLLMGLAGLAVSTALTALVPSYLYLYPLRLLGALAQAAYSTASLALVGDLLEGRREERGSRMGTYRGLASLGFGMWALVSGTLADRFSLRLPYVLSALFLAISFVLAWRLRERPATAPPPGKKSSPIVQGAPPDRRLPLTPLLVAAFLWALTTGAVYAVWANYMVDEVGFRASGMSALWALASTSELPLMILAGWLSDRLGRLPVLSLGFAVWACVFTGYVFIPVLPWIIGLQLLRGVAYSSFTAAAMTYAAEARGRARRGMVSGSYNMALGLGSIAGSAAGGGLTDLLGFRPMIGLAAGAMLMGAIYLAGTAWRWRRVPRNDRPTVVGS